MSLFLNKNSHSGRNNCICSVLQRSFARASPRDKAISSNQPIQETRVVCNIVAGVMTLVMACAFLGGWLRSLRGIDATSFSIGSRSLVQLISRDGSVAVRRIKSQFPVSELSVDGVVLTGFKAPVGNSTINLVVSVDAAKRTAQRSPYRRIMNGYGFEIGGVVDREYQLQVYIVGVPHWLIVIPLTLLSAYLLLSKPTVAKPTAVTEN